jgi:competence protein ComEA
MFEFRSKPEADWISAAETQTYGTAAPSSVEERSNAGQARDEPGSETATPAKTSSDTQKKLIPIYLVGAIEQPGIYQVEQGSYLYQLIEQAGGLTRAAAAEDIDLALELTSNQRIYIPTRAEVEAHPEQAQLLIEQDAKPKLININTASTEDLDALPGIGPATAKAIVDYRQRNGPFNQPADLMGVPGIKQSRFDSIADLITVG